MHRRPEPLSVDPDPFPPRASRVRAAVLTDRGFERPGNEDASGLLASTPFVGVVCDGMGGEAGGEIASRLAVDTILSRLGDLGAEAIAPALVQSIEAAGARIQHEARVHPRYARMGTTATVAAIGRGVLVCAHVGDSRAYLLRRGALVQVTRDQTLLELLRSKAGFEEAAECVGAHIILQAVGCSPNLEVAVTHTPVEEGDVVLLCSDGLSGVVDDAAIARTLADHPDPADACAALVARALEAGAPDNVTCLVLRVEA